MASLNELFEYADIDDVTREEHDGSVCIQFTPRSVASSLTGERFDAWGQDLDDAVDAAMTIVAREMVFRDLRNEGLTDADISALADYRHPEMANGLNEAWDRGYDAAVADLTHNQQAINEPAMAAAGEPFDAKPTPDTEAILAQYPLMSVVYAPVAIIQNGTKGD